MKYLWRGGIHALTESPEARMPAPSTRPTPPSPERRGSELLAALRKVGREGTAHLAWLEAHAPALSAGSLGARPEALVALATGLDRLAQDRQLVLLDREDELVVARLDVPGSIVETLQTLQQRGIACSEIFHSDEPVPGQGRVLEIQRYVFVRRPGPDATPAPSIPARLRRDVLAGAEARTPPVPPRDAVRLLELLWNTGELALRRASAGQLVQLVWLLAQCDAHQGVFLAAEERGDGARDEAHVLFALRSPPQRDFIAQVMEVFNALDLGVRRSFTFTLAAGPQPVFLGSFHLMHRKGETITPGSPIFRRLRAELHNTQILNTDSPTYRDFVLARVMTGEEASLVNAFIGFCHTNCAHNQPSRYTLEDVVRAFHSHPDISLRLVRLFELRFDPEVQDRETRWARESAEVEQEVAEYNTGHRALDDFRRSLFRTALSFVRRTLKTNFYVAEKHALAFRLDPAYLADLGPEFTADLPPERPFRVTFFCTRSGVGFHIGFSDIARGGWRTILAETRDDYVTVANHVFRENYVLAHTQHLKNKDIYEGGSKLVFVLRVPDRKDRARTEQLLRKVQYGVASAFLDLLVTRDGVARDARVVDYYRQDEPVEIGPDENMHDDMIETIAALSVRRGYVLGTGIMSSKAVGINHKQYGVTSTGVVTFAEIAMRHRGVDITRDRFSVKLTGGPNGDVAGNGLRILLERCPGVEVRCVVDGTAALLDPAGLQREALSAIVLRADADGFDASRLSPGGFVLYRNVRRTEGLRELYRRVEMTAGGLREDWVTADEFHKEFDALLFTVEADLFIPAGGRPETIDAQNWRRYLKEDGTPSAPTIVEGANSFITPEARRLLQGAGAVILRDASANKCGVISSSYEIIGNLLLSEKEFLAHKEAYVRDVLAILVKRAADEANLIFRRRAAEGGKRLYTEISDAISLEINAQKALLFRFFEAHPDAWKRPAYRRALLQHLPALLREADLRNRVKNLPSKYRSAMLAAEIATTMVYRQRFEPSFEAALEEYATEMFPG
jgi:glutamate dehydrogenase